MPRETEEESQDRPTGRFHFGVTGSKGGTGEETAGRPAEARKTQCS